MSKTKTTTKPEEIASVKIGTGVTIRFWFPDCATIHFKKEPEEKVIDELKAAGFVLKRGSWHGRAEKIPDCVTEMIHPKTGFTPGPWTAVQHGDGIYTWTIRGNDEMEDRSLAFVGVGTPNLQRDEANMHLIAAAPDMYSMLQSILDECEICSACFQYPGDITPRQQIEEVLAKARGEEVSE